MKSLRMFYEVPADGLTDWIQIFPGPGRYRHPNYGILEVTPEKLQRLERSFADKVYQEHIPIDAEHRTKESGALGYYREVQARHDGLYARIEPTRRGRQLLDDGSFKYFSAELYPTWESPTGERYEDVLIGGAFTTRPFFKDSQQQPFAASENGCDEMTFADLSQESDEESEEDKEEDDESKEEQDDDEHNEMHPKKKEMSMNEQAFTELQQKYAEAETKIKTLESERDAAKAESQAMGERVTSLESAARRKRYTDLVTGHGGAKDGQHWFGEAEKHVGILMELQEKFGEDSDIFKSYVEQQERTAEAIAASVANAEIGRTPMPAKSGAANERFNAAVAAKMDAGTKERAQAIAAVARENPQLYTEYQRERNAAAKATNSTPY